MVTKKFVIKYDTVYDNIRYTFYISRFQVIDSYYEGHKYTSHATKFTLLQCRRVINILNNKKSSKNIDYYRFNYQIEYIKNSI